MSDGCPDRRQLTAYLHGAVAPDESNRIRSHLSDCQSCREAATDVASSGADRATETWTSRTPSTAEYRKPAAEANPGVGDVAGVAPAPPRATAVPIPGHEILSLLGEGGMARVYRARELGPNRLVALKTTQRRPTADSRQRFRLEFTLLAQLEHPHIVRLYQTGEVDGEPYFTMELCEGGSLRDRIQEHVYASADAASVVRALARAMHAAHALGIIHRDLKTSNVLLTADGTPKLSDFGLARDLGDADSPTLTGDVLGTPRYMAPEQARGELRQIGPRTDVYGLGTILYELLTGNAPFRGATTSETIDQVLHRDPVAPSAVVAGVPRDLETICLACLRKEPERRYATAAALADDLDRFLRGEPILARPVTAVERLSKWARRNPMVASLSGTLVLVVVSSLAVLAGMLVQVTFEKRRAESAFRQTYQALQQAKEAYTSLARTEENLGRQQAAAAAYERVAALSEGLAHAHPQFTELQRDLARDYTRLADSYARIGETEQAVRWTERARTTFAQLWQTHRQPADEIELAMALGNLAVWKPVTVDATMQRLKEVEAILARNEPQMSGELRLFEGFAIVYTNLGHLVAKRNDLDQAEQYYKQAITACRRITEMVPAAERFHTELELGDALNSLAVTYRQRGQYSEALDRYNDALQRGTALREAGSTDKPLLNFLARIHNNRAVVLEHLGRMDEGLADRKQAVAIRESLARQDPTDIEIGYGVCNAHFNLARRLQQNNQLDEAERYLTLCIQNAKSWLQRFPAQADIQAVLGRAYRTRGDVGASRGQRDQAAQAYGLAVEIQRRLHNADPADDERANDLVATLGNLTRNYQHQRDYTAAEKLLDEIIPLEQGMLSRSPERADLQLEYSMTLELRGDNYDLLDQGPAALQAYEEMAAVRRRLLHRHPTDPRVVNLCISGLRSQGELIARRGEPTAALPVLEEALQLTQTKVAGETLIDPLERGATLHEYGLCLIALGKPDDADRALEEAGQTLWQACQAAPESHHRRQWLVEHARESAHRAGRYAAAIQHLKAMRDLAPSDAAHLAELGQHLAGLLVSSSGEPAPGLDEVRPEILEQAMILLQDAVQGGYRDHEQLARSAALMPLHSHPEWPQLLAAAGAPRP